MASKTGSRKASKPKPRRSGKAPSNPPDTTPTNKQPTKPKTKPATRKKPIRTSPSGANRVIVDPSNGQESSQTGQVASNEANELANNQASNQENNKASNQESNETNNEENNEASTLILSQEAPQVHGARPRSAVQRDLDRAEVVKLFKRGWTIDSIAYYLGRTPEQVEADWLVVAKRAMQVREREAVEKVAMILEEYAEVKAEAWQAWEKSKEDHTKFVTEKSSSSKKPSKDGEEDNDGGGNRPKFIKRIKHVDGRLPGNEYLKTILQCLDAEAELQNLKPKKQLEVKAAFEWDMLAEEVKSDPPDRVEERLRLIQVANSGLNPPENAPNLPKNEPIDVEFAVKTPENGSNLPQNHDNSDKATPITKPNPVQEQPSSAFAESSGSNEGARWLEDMENGSNEDEYNRRNRKNSFKSAKGEPPQVRE